MPTAPIKYIIALTPEARQVLQEIVRAGKSERRLADRARIILWADDGVSIRESARRLGCSKQTVQNWRHWYLNRRNEGMSIVVALTDRPRSGRPSTFSPSPSGPGEGDRL